MLSKYTASYHVNNVMFSRSAYLQGSVATECKGCCKYVEWIRKQDQAAGVFFFFFFFLSPPSSKNAKAQTTQNYMISLYLCMAF